LGASDDAREALRPAGGLGLGVDGALGLRLGAVLRGPGALIAASEPVRDGVRGGGGLRDAALGAEHEERQGVLAGDLAARAGAAADAPIEVHGDVVVGRSRAGPPEGALRA